VAVLIAGRDRSRRQGLRRRRTTEHGTSLDVLRLRAEAGAPITDTDLLPERARRAVRVAEAVGAPVLAAIDAARAAEDDAVAASRAVTVASAQSKAVAGGLLVAPLVLVPALGRVAGVDLLGFYRTSFGLLVLAAGTLVLGLGAASIVVLVRRVGAAARPPRAGSRPAIAGGVLGALLAWRAFGAAAAPLAFVVVQRLLARRFEAAAPAAGVDEAADLAAVAVCGGTGAAEALRQAATELPDLASRLHRLAFSLDLGMGADDLGGAVAPAGRGPARLAPDDPLRRLAVLIAAADEVGAPLAPTLRRLARDLRADELTRVLAAAERLPAQLTFPTALALLPATVLLIGAPIVHAGLAGAGL
jgi:hypothetical protein